MAHSNISKRMPNTNAMGIQSGAVTHHQDHVITLVSLSTRNTKNKRLKKLVPQTVTEDFVLLFIMSFLWFQCIIPFHGSAVKGA
jgi:cytochrome c biogenesis protein CcdA